MYRTLYFKNRLISLLSWRTFGLMRNKSRNLKQLLMFLPLNSRMFIIIWITFTKNVFSSLVSILVNCPPLALQLAYNNEYKLKSSPNVPCSSFLTQDEHAIKKTRQSIEIVKRNKQVRNWSTFRNQTFNKLFPCTAEVIFFHYCYARKISLYIYLW